MERNELYENAKTWSLEAGQMIKESFSKTIAVAYKTSAADLVTEMDKAIERFFIGKINEAYPDHYVLGEEGQSTSNQYDPKKESVWIIDPIDGTTNFVHQKRNFAISVGFYEKGEPVFGIVYDPIQEELFHAYVGKGAFLNDQKLEKRKKVPLEEAILNIGAHWVVPNEKLDHTILYPLVQQARGIRYVGSAALEMAYIAAGRIDAYIDFRLSSWDIAGGLILLSEVQALSTTEDNKAIDVFQPAITVFSTPGLHEQILKVVNR